MQRDSIAVVLEDGRSVEVLRVRDPRARRIKLTVGDRGARLTLPPRASLAAGERFVHEHRDWLARQLEIAVGDVAPLTPGESTHLPLRDVLVPLHWREGRYARVSPEDGAIAIQLPARAGAAALGRALRDFYEAQARADVARWLTTYLSGLPRAPRRIRLRPMSSQWGSLAPDDTVALDLSLVLGRPGAFEYVLVHELCHLIHANHSRAFWREVEARLPDWHRHRDYFRSDGPRLKAALHALLSCR